MGVLPIGSSYWICGTRRVIVCYWNIQGMNQLIEGSVNDVFLAVRGLLHVH